MDEANEARRDQPKQGPTLRITRLGLQIDATRATVMTGEWSWEQIDAYREALRRRDVELPRFHQQDIDEAIGAKPKPPEEED